ncbi:InlB B-repeat-containing protein [Olsenella intestinalis]|uniref:InlB B-repeat-containing protein n=1 Tax=Olsenella intestinalis TaxID=2930083 RepID=UPI002010275F|nr:InlB B-repeat-containing protein [Olsenella intestinalis]
MKRHSTSSKFLAVTLAAALVVGFWPQGAVGAAETDPAPAADAATLPAEASSPAEPAAAEPSAEPTEPSPEEPAATEPAPQDSAAEKSAPSADATSGEGESTATPSAGCTSDAASVGDSANEPSAPAAPAIDETRISENGVAVEVHAPEGAFPEGTMLVVREADARDAMAAAEAAGAVRGRATDARAVDVSFVRDGRELEPAGTAPVRVSLRAINAVRGEAFSAIHVRDDGQAEVVDKGATASRADFDATDFSVYAIVGEDIKYQSWEFYNAAGELHFAVSVKTTDYEGADKESQAAQRLAATGVPAVFAGDDTTEFVGWYLKGDDGAWGDAWAGYPDTVSFDGSVTRVYAKYRDKKHYVSYHSAVDSDADGTFDKFPIIHVVEVNAGENLAVSAGTPLFVTPAGTANVGWSTRNGAASSDSDVYGYGGESKLTVDADTDLYPVIEGGYWVTFDSAGGTGIDSQFVSEGKTAKSPSDPTRKGYAFTGWVDEKGEAFDFKTPITTATTLRATWTEAETTYRLRFYLQGAEPKDTIEEDYSFDANYHFEVTATTGQTLSLSADDPAVVQAIADHYTVSGFAYYFVNDAQLQLENAKGLTVAADGSTEFTVYLDRMYYYWGNANFKRRWGQSLEGVFRGLSPSNFNNKKRLKFQCAGYTILWMDYPGNFASATPSGIYGSMAGYGAKDPSLLYCGATFSFSVVNATNLEWKYNRNVYLEKLDSTGEDVQSNYDTVSPQPIFWGDHGEWACNPGYEGFTLLRWSSNVRWINFSGGGRRLVCTFKGSKRSQQYYLWYTRNKHNILWNENGGPDASDLTAIPYQRNLTGTAAPLAGGSGSYVAYDKDPDEEGFVRPTVMTDATGDHWFNGWHKVNTLVDQTYSFDGVTMPDSDIVLYADWTDARCKVTYDLAGGTLAKDAELKNRSASAGEKSATDVLKYGEQATSLSSAQITPPEGSGDLLGWTYESAGQDVTWSFANEVHSDVTLKAVYAPEGATTKSYKITYAAGEDATGTAPTDDNTYLKGATAFMPSGAALRKDGRPFLYWRDASGDAHYAGSRYTVSGDATLTAVYSTEADAASGRTGLTYDYNYGSMSPNTSLASLTADGSATREVYVNQAMDLDEVGYPDVSGATPVGYAFSGWYADAARTSRLGDVIVDASSAAGENRVFAGWTRNAYKVAFDKNDALATGEMAPEDFEYDIAKPLSPLGYSKAGYHFDGWATTAAGDAAYADKAPVTNLTATDGATVTLFATWEANPYHVSFNKGADAASGTMATQDLTYDAAATPLSANAFSNKGRHFAGWATEAGGASAYADKASVQNLTTENDATVDLYATWGDNTFQAAPIEGAFTYDGGAHTPEPRVTGEGGTVLTKDVDYELVYSNNVNAAAATDAAAPTVTVCAKAGGDYQFAPDVTLHFTIGKATWDPVDATKATTTQSIVTATLSGEASAPTDEKSGTLALTDYDGAKPVEYSTDAGATWQDLPADGRLSGLAAGDVSLRYKEDDNHFASAPTVVEVLYGVRGNVTWDYNYAYVEGASMHSAVVNDTPQERSSAGMLYLLAGGAAQTGYPVTVTGATDPGRDATLTHAYGTYSLDGLSKRVSYTLSLKPTVANSAGTSQIETGSYAATQRGDDFDVNYVGVGNFDGKWAVSVESTEADGYADLEGVYVKVFWASRDEAEQQDASLYEVVSQQNDATLGTYCAVSGSGAARAATGSLPVWKLNTDGFPSRYRARIMGFRVGGVDYPCAQDFLSSLESPLYYDAEKDDGSTQGQDPMRVTVSGLAVPMVALDLNDGGATPAAALPEGVANHVLGSPEAAPATAWRVARTAVEAARPAWDGHEFEGWFESASPTATDRLAADVEGLASRKTLYAHWSENQGVPEGLAATRLTAQRDPANDAVLTDGSGAPLTNDDGTITGVTDAMEWRRRADDGTWPDAWTRVGAGEKSVAGLSADTYQVRYAATEATDAAWARNVGEPAEVVVSAKSLPDAPPAPIVDSATATTLVVRVEDGQQYSVDAGAHWVTPAAGAATHVFEGLTPGTEQHVVTRLAETDDAYPSPASPEDKVELPLLKLDVTTPEALYHTYSGEPQHLVEVAQAPEGCVEVKYGVGSDDDMGYVDEPPQETVVGTYPVRVWFVGDDIHEDEVVVVQGEIVRADNAWTDGPTAPGWVAGQERPAHTATARFGNASFWYAPAGSDEFVATPPTEPGEYVVRAAVDGTPNYFGLDWQAPLTVAADALTYLPNSIIAMGSTAATEGKTGDAVAAAGCDFTWPQHRFKGWNTAPDGSGASYQPGDPFTLTAGDDVLYAQWDPVGELAYDGNGADSGSVEPRLGRAGDSVPAAANGFVRRAWRFTGWNTAADGSGRALSPGEPLELAISGNILYAQWAPRQLAATLPEGAVAPGVLPAEPRPAVTDAAGDGPAPVEGVDYALSWEGNAAPTEPGRPARVTVTPLKGGQYELSEPVTLDFEIPRSLGRVVQEEVPSNWGGARIGQGDEAIAAAVPLTREEAAQVGAGATAYVSVSVTDVTKSIAPADAARIHAAAGEATQPGAFLDVRVRVRVGDGEAREVHELASPLTVELSLPGGLSGSAVAAVVREHDGTVQAIDFESDGAALRASSDRFSIFEVAVSPDARGARPLAKTGDATAPAVPVALAALAVAALAAALRARRREQ